MLEGHGLSRPLSSQQGSDNLFSTGSQKSLVQIKEISPEYSFKLLALHTKKLKTHLDLYMLLEF